MEQPRLPVFTAEEFIAWALEQPAGRFELDNGTVVAMAPEHANHATAKGNAFMALRTAINASGPRGPYLTGDLNQGKSGGTETSGRHVHVR